MPYPNNLEIYDYKLTVKQAETLYKTANDKKKFYENRLRQAAKYFNKHKHKILKFGIVVNLVDKKNDTTHTIDTRSKKPDTTHEKYYKEDYETFVREINDAISELWWGVEIENEVSKCEKEKTVKKKLLAYIACKKRYEEFLWDIEITLKDSNPKEYEEDKTLYAKHLQSIEKRINELLEKKETAGFCFWIKRFFKASKIKTPISETDLDKIINE